MDDLTRRQNYLEKLFATAIQSAIGAGVTFDRLVALLQDEKIRHDAKQWFRCDRCLGCGRIADSDRGEAWTHWERLPRGSDAAVKMGLVNPIPCPSCAGKGLVEKRV